MNFEYTGRHIEVTPALRSHVENHFDKLKHLFNGQAMNAHVIIEVAKGRHRAEIIIHWRDHTLTATTTVSDMYKALTQTITKLEKQATRLKDKVIDKNQRATKTSIVATPADDDDIAPAPSEPRIINSRSYKVKPMTAEEAILSMQTEENQFLVFRDAEKNEKISVIYRRKDGNFGLIQP
jgi:putative sigma-54 modulation protein